MCSLKQALAHCALTGAVQSQDLAIVGFGTVGSYFPVTGTVALSTFSHLATVGALRSLTSTVLGGEAAPTWDLHRWSSRFQGWRMLAPTALRSSEFDMWGVAVLLVVLPMLLQAGFPNACAGPVVPGTSVVATRHLLRPCHCTARVAHAHPFSSAPCPSQMVLFLCSFPWLQAGPLYSWISLGLYPESMAEALQSLASRCRLHARPGTLQLFLQSCSK